MIRIHIEQDTIRAVTPYHSYFPKTARQLGGCYIKDPTGKKEGWVFPRAVLDDVIAAIKKTFGVPPVWPGDELGTVRLAFPEGYKSAENDPLTICGHVIAEVWGRNVCPGPGVSIIGNAGKDYPNERLITLYRKTEVIVLNWPQKHLEHLPKRVELISYVPNTPTPEQEEFAQEPPDVRAAITLLRERGFVVFR